MKKMLIIACLIITQVSNSSENEPVYDACPFSQFVASSNAARLREDQHRSFMIKKAIAYDDPAGIVYWLNKGVRVEKEMLTKNCSHTTRELLKEAYEKQYHS